MQRLTNAVLRKRTKTSVDARMYCGRMLFAVPSFLIETFCKDVSSVRNDEKIAFCWSSVNNYSMTRPSVAAEVCTAVEALGT